MQTLACGAHFKDWLYRYEPLLLAVFFLIMLAVFSVELRDLRDRFRGRMKELDMDQVEYVIDKKTGSPVARRKR